MASARLGLRHCLNTAIGTTIVLCSPWCLAQQAPGLQSSASSDGLPHDGVEPAASLSPQLPESGFEFGLGVGFAKPLGDADNGASLFDTGGQAPNSGLQIRNGTMSGIVSYRVPLVLDLGYRLSPQWWLGVRPEMGTGSFGTECPNEATCNWSDLRLGVQARYHFSPKANVDPWLGLNLAWEWLRSSASIVLPPEVTGLSSSQAVAAKQLIHGPLLELLGGLSFDLGHQLHAGPFLSAAAGRYLRSTFDCPTEALGCPDPAWIDDGAFHAWVSLGVSGTHGP